MGFNLLDKYLKDIKPTANTKSLDVRATTVQWGAELIVEGFPTLSYSRANRCVHVFAQQSSLPWETPAFKRHDGFRLCQLLSRLSEFDERCPATMCG